MSGRIAQDFIQRLLEQVNITDVVSNHVTIKLKGKDHSGCCPFHQEKTPSFTVSSEKQFYHCFGCGAHGNAIGFLMAINHQSFPEAVQDLASQVGLDVVYEGGAPAENHEPAYRLLEQAAQFYQASLKSSHEAQSYVSSRGVSEDAQRYFQVGYAPNDWHALKAIKNSANDDSQLLSCGLLVENKSRYDRFRDRIMFPIRNTQGKVVGFGGRALGDAKPKYLNSPETPVFHKNHELYGLYEARQAQPKLPYVIIVEGYMDVITLFQYQYPMAIATLGTAVNPTHIKKILRYTKRMVFCFDGDAAGQRASWKALQATLPLLSQGVDVKFLTLSDQLDPDTFLRRFGREAFKKALEQAPRLPEKLFTELEQRYPLDHIANQAQFAHEAMQCIQSIPAGFYHDLMINALAERLKLDHSQLMQLTEKKPIPAKNNNPSPPTPVTAQPTQASTAIKQINSLLMHHPALINSIDHQFQIADNPACHESSMLKQLLQLLRDKPKTTTGQLFAHFATTPLAEYSSELARINLFSSEHSHEDTLKQTIKTLQLQQYQQKVDQLLQRSKSEGLNLDEKRLLQRLLTQINENKRE